MAHKKKERGPGNNEPKQTPGEEQATAESEPEFSQGPPREETGELEGAVNEAEGELDNLEAEAKKLDWIDRVIDAMSPYKMELSGFWNRNASWTTYNNEEEAERHSREIRKRNEEELAQEGEGETATESQEARFEWARNIGGFFEKYIIPVTPIINAIERRRNRRFNEDITEDLMTRERLGDELYEAVADAPPVLTTESEEFFELGDRVSGSTACGRYYCYTNHITIESSEGGKNEADRREIIAHEQRHYYSHKGRSVNGNASPPDWLDEGITELGAQRYVREEGFQPSGVSYQTEVAATAYLEDVVQSEMGEVAGAEALERAYLTGDFSNIEKAVDKVLGKGTFAEFVEKENGAEALEFLASKIKESGLDYSGWNDDVVLQDTWLDLGEIWKNA
ncbi:hypothetical protein GF415_01610 [Candidatus Micrarchaeota archaeon]|nr:hypothetical protein [Candidatus Micrarchaeota archaeon]